MFLIIIPIVLILIAVFLTAAEIILRINTKPAPTLPETSMQAYYSGNVNNKTFEQLYSFLSGAASDISFSEDEIYAILKTQCDYVNNRYDCSDFKLQLLFRIYKDCYSKLSENCRQLIKITFLSFKYFMDEPGIDSMCYWSENHQIMFAVSEYLAGQEWPDEFFSNSGINGHEHLIKAETRIKAWMKQRFDYGFSEYLSNNYLAEDISPMANFITYCKNEKMTNQMKIIMDILWLDVALNSTKGRLCSASSRMYGNNKSGNYLGNSIKTALNILWKTESSAFDKTNDELENELIEDCLNAEANHIILCFTETLKQGFYNLPKAIHDIGVSNKTFISKMSCGLSPDDLYEEDLIGQDVHKIMAQLGAEAFTNHQVIKNSLKYFENNEMLRNSFVHYFKYLSLSLFRCVNLEKLAKRINCLPHGIALGRGNIYSYRTKDFCLSTNISCSADMCGAQEHIWSADISENLALFSTHPSGNGNDRFTDSPGYWIGNGRKPMSIQHKNINITIYRIPGRKRMGEKNISDITHLYFPKCFYDEYELKENMVFARKHKCLIAIIMNGTPFFKPYDENSVKGIYKNRIPDERFCITGEFDLCRKGKGYHFYITEISDTETESFDDFRKRILSNHYNFSENGTAEYSSFDDSIFVSYGGEYKINGIDENTVFSRYDSIFCKAERKSNSITVNSGTHTLYLNFEDAERKQN